MRAAQTAGVVAVAVGGFLDDKTVIGHAQVLTSSGKNYIATWDLQTGSHTELITLEHDLDETLLSPSKKLLAGTQMGRDNHGLYVYDLQSKRQLFAVETLPGITHIAFSPDERWLAAACGDCGVRVYDLSKFAANPTAASGP